MPTKRASKLVEIITDVGERRRAGRGRSAQLGARLVERALALLGAHNLAAVRVLETLAQLLQAQRQGARRRHNQAFRAGRVELGELIEIRKRSDVLARPEQAGRLCHARMR